MNGSKHPRRFQGSPISDFVAGNLHYSIRITLGSLLLSLPLFAALYLNAKVDFLGKVRPILSDTCYKCHGPDSKARKAKLRLDKRNAAFSEKDGVTPIVPNDLAKSEVIRRITSKDPDERMPPPDSGLELTTAQIEVLSNWVNEGADWPENDRHWSFIPPVRPEAPQTKNKDWPRNDLDRFVLARLEKESLHPSPETDKETLLRRVTFDLTGLPPSPEEMDDFIANDSNEAYEKVVDRLLHSPHYGEHIASSWLDAARYADTDGYQNDRTRHMWVWRDWVIRSLNENKPFDRFIVEQMAGDLLPERDFLTQVATGYNRNHRINSEGGSIPDEWIVEYVADRVETLGTIFLGLTLNCSRCHDHKYDPVTQRDFYSLFAFFNGIDEAGLGPNNGNSPPFIPVPKSWPNLKPEENKFVVPEKMKIKVVQTSVPRPQPGSANTVMVMHELPKPRSTYILERGQYDHPDKSENLSPAIPSIIGGWKKQWPVNRIGLAQWLIAPEHPLTARVTVNRFWQRLFGIGLVKTSENFGIQGEHPSHPELLDWLATEFIRRDWNIKDFHKLLVTSATYRQVSTGHSARDPENRLLSRGSRRRLPPYAIRDAALANSGLLVRTIGGPSVRPYMPPRIWKSISNNAYKQDKGDKLYRRSLYTYWRRTIPPPTMMTFNAADREVCIVRKDQTITPLQALTLLNNVTFVESARHLAERMLKLKGKQSQRDRIAYGFRSITGRRPIKEELNLLFADLKVHLESFSLKPEAAKAFLKVGQRPNDAKLSPEQIAAYALIASTIMNLDEAITLN